MNQYADSSDKSEADSIEIDENNETRKTIEFSCSGPYVKVQYGKRRIKEPELFTKSELKSNLCTYYPVDDFYGKYLRFRIIWYY